MSVPGSTLGDVPKSGNVGQNPTPSENFKNMRQRLLAVGTISALVVLAGSATVNAQSSRAGFHVTICHRTGSASNPYIIISPDAQGVVSGHLDHEQTGNGLGGDIVPMFTLNGISYSKNLGTDFGNGVTGAAILANGCRMPRNGSPTPTPTRHPPRSTPPPPAPVPEPMTIVLFGLGLAAIGIAAGRKFFTGN